MPEHKSVHIELLGSPLLIVTRLGAERDQRNDDYSGICQAGAAEHAPRLHRALALFGALHGSAQGALLRLAATVDLKHTMADAHLTHKLLAPWNVTY